MTKAEAANILLLTSGEKDAEVAAALGIPIADLEKHLTDTEAIEVCAGCGTWVYSCDMDSDGMCESCQ